MNYMHWIDFSKTIIVSVKRMMVPVLLIKVIVNPTFVTICYS